MNIDLVNESGSSPLARGLRGQDGGDAAPPGIIPARAGFTDPDRQDRRPRADHPRSRGVYDLSRRVTAAELGSSPLARGLRPGVIAYCDPRGIIPARAGFTGDEPHQGGEPEDHPRSRGVYRVPPRATPSPASDHPRSRGVYRRPPTGAGPHPGSSPLARGLQDPRDTAVVGAGIIPARAGFTGRAPRRAVRPRDHPRSRGVYHFPSPFCVGPVGSSPLARGLRTEDGEVIITRRIIPARAGFTRGAPPPPRRPPDHPRSRGVYGGSQGGAGQDPGSSPLARGLR